MFLNPSARAALATCLALAPLACGPPSVIADRDETIPIPRGASWAWAEPDTGSQWQRDPILGSEITHQRYTRAIEFTMQAKGFQKAASSDEADFLLSYHMGSPHAHAQGAAGTTTVAVGFGFGGMGWGRPGYVPYGYGPFDYGYGYGYGWPGWGWGLYGPPMYVGVGVAGPGSVPYHDGALFLLLRQRESGNVAWEVRYALDPYDTQRVTQQRVQEIVNAMFESLQ